MLFDASLVAVSEALSAQHGKTMFGSLIRLGCRAEIGYILRLQPCSWPNCHSWVVCNTGMNCRGQMLNNPVSPLIHTH